MKELKTSNVINVKYVFQLLKKHNKDVYGGINYHKCDYCGKSFSQAGHLKGHVKAVHEGIKDHKHNLCNKAFSSSDYLKYH